MNSFRVRHFQPDQVGVMLGYGATTGPIQIIPSNFSARSYRDYGDGSGAIYFTSLRSIPTPKGFVRGLEDSYGRQYGQKHGTIYRTN